MRGIRRRRHLSYTLWVGDGDMAETILSYLLAEESSNPQRISKKMGGLGSGEDGISLIPLGRDGEWEDYKTKMSWTMHPEKPGCGEALGQVPGGSGLGVNAEDHGSSLRTQSTPPSGELPRILTVNRIPYRIWFATSHQEVETKISFPLFRGNGSWCRISRIQSSSHHIISELKNSPPQAI